MSMNLSKSRRELVESKIDLLKENFLDNQEMISFLNELKNDLTKKKYGLIWEEHDEQVDIEMKDSIPVFKENIDMKICTNPEERYNFILEGDNLHSLYLLNKTRRKKIDLIYIDPPYNTGNNDFIYDDHFVNSDDGFIHSKWLSFMNRRLLLAKELLASNGVIFISIDDNEQSQLKLLCDEIFGRKNFIANVIRKSKAGSGHDSKFLSVEYDYILAYAKDINNVTFNKEKVVVEDDKKYRYEDEFVARRGKYYLRDLAYKGASGRESTWEIETPTGEFLKSSDDGRVGYEWRWGEKKFKWGLENDYIVFKKAAEKNKVYIKQYQFVDNEDKIRDRFIPHRAIMSYLNTEGTSEVNSILGQNVFSYPKPKSLIKHLIGLVDKDDLIVLDFFAGSGTTGHAVLEMNAEDNGNRKFILCTNNQNNICENVTYKRLDKIINGCKSTKGKMISASGGNLKYFKTAFVDKKEMNYYDYYRFLLPYIKELIELERGADIINSEFKCILSDDEADEFITIDMNCKVLYKSCDVLFTIAQKRILFKKEVEIIDIPSYYFKETM